MRCDLIIRWRQHSQTIPLTTSFLRSSLLVGEFAANSNVHATSWIFSFSIFLSFLFPSSSTSSPSLTLGSLPCFFPHFPAFLSLSQLTSSPISYIFPFSPPSGLRISLSFLSPSTTTDHHRLIIPTHVHWSYVRRYPTKQCIVPEN